MLGVCVARWPYVWVAATPSTRWRAAFGQHDGVNVEARAWQLRELPAAQVALAGLPRCDQHLLQRLLAAGRREEGLVALLARRHVSCSVVFAVSLRLVVADCPRTWLGGGKLRKPPAIIPFTHHQREATETGRGAAVLNCSCIMDGSWRAHGSSSSSKESRPGLRTALDAPTPPAALALLRFCSFFFAPKLWRPGVPRYAVRTARPRPVRVRRTYCAWGPGGKLPCAFGTYSTQEAGTRSLYVQHGGSGTYESA